MGDLPGGLCTENLTTKVTGTHIEDRLKVELNDELMKEERKHW